MSEFGLPEGFIFGTSTAAAQIEGAVNVGGRGPSIWDEYASTHKNILDASSPAIACDHYNRFEEDFDLLRDLGGQAYRLSIAWPRIQPTGHGPANPEGVAFYHRLLDALIERGIQPWVTIYHWDLPLAMQDAGGWQNRDTIDAFVEYTRILRDEYGSKVAAWMTVNEPVVHTGVGHAVGHAAPGLMLLGSAFTVAHHLLLAHGRATRVLRETLSTPVGIVNNHSPVEPAGDSEKEARLAALYNSYHNGQFAAPLLTGAYPAELEELEGIHFDVIQDGDMDIISTPLDFYGINYYFPTKVGAAPPFYPVPFAPREYDGVPVTDFNWPVMPGGLTEILKQLKAAYPNLPPVYITENGCAYDDGPGGDTQDTRRIKFLEQHLSAIGDAVAGGVDVRGYFHWTLMDNWEWQEGYTKKFGLIRMEPSTLDRVPRASFHRFADIIAAHRAPATNVPPVIDQAPSRARVEIP
ncbi:GH1 family beta-glucosidase [Arthrobacter sp. H5]|uniref:GH1 family beta-glucosidase n=1 Tax=Arthrobacter sp. H5 TaxID=1267973 RepID=UPI0004B539B8|nr:GH1 family beta-glucosidase [Arthrobacter sp. H5]